MTDKKDFARLAMPFLRLGAVAVFAAALAVTVGLVTAPITAERERREESGLLKRAANGLEPGRRYVAFPLVLDQKRFAERILSRCRSWSERLRILACYEAGPDGVVALKPGLAERELNSLSLLLEAIGYDGRDTVRAYYPVKSAGAVTGYVLELEGRGFGGGMELLAFYDADGTLANALFREQAESLPGEKIERLLGLFTGTKAAGVPVSKRMVSRRDADAVSGATVTFMGLGLALRDGSRFVNRLGERLR